MQKERVAWSDCYQKQVIEWVWELEFGCVVRKQCSSQTPPIQCISRVPSMLSYIFVTIFWSPQHVLLLTHFRRAHATWIDYFFCTFTSFHIIMIRFSNNHVLLPISYVDYDLAPPSILRYCFFHFSSFQHLYYYTIMSFFFFF